MSTGSCRYYDCSFSRSLSTYLANACWVLKIPVESETSGLTFDFLSRMYRGPHQWKASMWFRLSNTVTFSANFQTLLFSARPDQKRHFRSKYLRTHPSLSLLRISLVQWKASRWFTICSCYYLQRKLSTYHETRQKSPPASCHHPSPTIKLVVVEANSSNVGTPVPVFLWASGPFKIASV